MKLDEPRPSTIVYTKFLLDYAKRNPQVVLSIESKFSHLLKLVEYYGHASDVLVGQDYNCQFYQY
jgi:hypothetical protein